MQVPSTTDGDYPVTPVPGFADPVSSWTHLLAAAVVLVAGTLLVARFRGPVRDRVGLAYSFGAVFEFLQPPFLIPGVIGPHEVFHFAVIVGVIYHWGFVKQATLLALTATSGA
ncbi:MAG: hypothetical protein CMJ90_13555 [Planctomycetes bacterium]|nr:hypothetical protein [Planctomycetota bacterium]